MVYTFQGNVFVKKERTIGNQGASHITTNSSLLKFLDLWDMSHITSLQPTAPPFPWEEITVLLPPTAQQGGIIVHPHPDQEASTAIAAQHRGPTAPPNPKQDDPTTPQQLLCPCF